MVSLGLLQQPAILEIVVVGRLARLLLQRLVGRPLERLELQPMQLLPTLELAILKLVQLDASQIGVAKLELQLGRPGNRTSLVGSS